MNIVVHYYLTVLYSELNHTLNSGLFSTHLITERGDGQTNQASERASKGESKQGREQARERERERERASNQQLCFISIGDYYSE